MYKWHEGVGPPSGVRLIAIMSGVVGKDIASARTSSLIFPAGGREPSICVNLSGTGTSGTRIRETPNSRRDARESDWRQLRQ